MLPLGIADTNEAVRHFRLISRLRKRKTLAHVTPRTSASYRDDILITGIVFFGKISKASAF